ncbi:MAG TPA: dolichyl-phosphate beta-glucosyltransferase [Methylomirabilota bacterium]|nr:dolichyl-phosphate beta-glucosyltransferase [Methylomirabilota bacterium]
MTAPRPRWSVVIPALNEARRLPPYLAEVAAYFEARGEPHEIIVVDDGSTDGTASVVAAAARRSPSITLVRHASNSGKGFAVRAGMRVAAGDYRLFADADGATPIAELKRLEAALAAGADVAIGSRSVPDPGVEVVARPHRVAAGRIFHWLAALIGLRGVVDSQCGFKAFTAAAAADLFGRLRTEGFGFDVELLLLAQRAGYRVDEVAVNWTEREGSKVRVLTDGPAMVWQIVRARLRAGRAACR